MKPGGWGGGGYRSHQEPGPGIKEGASAVHNPTGGGRGGGHELQGYLSQPPEEELERLTKKLVHDMSHLPSGEYFGQCGGCGEDVVDDGAGVVALDRVFNIGCFTCSTCPAQLGASTSMLWRGRHIVRAAMWSPWRNVPHALNPSWTES